MGPQEDPLAIRPGHKGCELLLRRQGDLAEWLATVDKKPTTRSQRRSDALQRLLFYLRVTTIQGTDPDGEREVEGLLVRPKSEVLHGHVADAHASRANLLGRVGLRLSNRLRRSIDGEDVAVYETRGHRPRRRAGAAPDLQDACVRLQRQRVHHGRKPRRETSQHETRLRPSEAPWNTREDSANRTAGDPLVRPEAAAIGVTEDDGRRVSASVLEARSAHVLTKEGSPLMAKLTILYGHPDDPVAFENYYANRHLPFAQETMPGVRQAELTKVVDTPDSSAPPYYRVAEMWWDSMRDLRAALHSEKGQAVLDDLPNFATGGTTLLISEPD